jgi:adenylate kinase family enzyme
MTVKLFVFGCSGSGKSTAAHHIVKLAQDKGYSAIHVSDYEILYNMFQADIEAKGEKFRLADAKYGGFDVLDLAVYDKALMQLEQAALLSSSQANDFIILEFARDDYSKALSLFTNGFLKDAYFLFLDSDTRTCIRRINNRVIHPTTKDDHFVPKHIVKTFRHKDNKQYIASDLKTDYGFTDKRVKIIDNTGSSMSFFKEVTRFAQGLLKKEIDISRETDQVPSISVPASINEANQKVHVSQQTEPIQIVAPIDDSVES